MSLLGDFLEAIYGPTDRFRSVRAVIEQCQDPAARGRALESEKPHFGRKKVGSGSKTNASPQKTTLRVWLGGPNKVRIEETRQLNGVVQSSLTVVGGDRWWERDHQGHVEEGETEKETRRPGPNLTDIERHFFSASLREYCAGLALESLGTVRTANRDCVRVRAVPRPDGRLWPHWLGFGADEYELHADPERGVLLYVASKCLGELLEWNEVTEVFFDEVLADEFFTYEPQLGEQVRPSQPVVEYLTLAAAMRRMPFTVLIPTRVPDSDHARVEVMFHPASVNDSRTYLALMYMGTGHLSVHQSATPASLDEWEWEQVERDGRRMEISDPGPGEGTRLVRLEHLGTHVDIWADLDREQVLDLAASLAPASG
jgi:hypothetical protein